MEIYLYTEFGCGVCMEAKGFRAVRGISFQERDIRSNPEYQRILTDDVDSRTTPTLVANDMINDKIDDKIIVGFDPEEYRFLLASPAWNRHG
jgi:glutaredoxin